MRHKKGYSNWIIYEKLACIEAACIEVYRSLAPIPFSFICLIAVIVTKFLGTNLPGWTASMATILFLGGIQLFTIGVLGVYLGRVYKEVKNRPNYIIESMVGFDES